MTAPAQGQPADFRTDEIVVAKPHCELVLGELRSFSNKRLVVDIRATPRLGNQVKSVKEEDSDPLLGLSIIKVEYVYREDDDDGATLEALMAAVRASCARKYANWVPTIGKNRLLERIDPVVVGDWPANLLRRYGVSVTMGRPKGGGGGPPERADEGGIEEFERVLKANEGRGRGIKVALLDTKIYKYPGDISKGWNIGKEARLPNDGKSVPYPAGHATFVAGLISQQAPSIDLEPVTVLNDQGEADAWDLAREMVRLAGSDGTQVLNLSLGCFTDDNLPPLLFRRAIELLAPNTVIVAAAGNHGGDNPEYAVEPNAPFWPAALDYVIGVGAATKRNSNERASFSPDPRAAPWVRLLEPGDQVTSTSPEKVLVPEPNGATRGIDIGGYAKWSGTSFAAATATGKIAALMAALKEEGKLLSPPKLVSLSGEKLKDLLGLSAEKLKALLDLSPQELVSLSGEELKDLLDLPELLSLSGEELKDLLEL